MTTVKRISKGESLEIAAGDTVAQTRVESTDPVRVQVLETRKAKTPSYELRLVQALTRKSKFEETIKRGTELGVTTFIPIVSEHTVRVPNNPEKQHRRWRKISMDSARVTGRDWTPEIGPIRTFDEFLEESSPPLYFGREKGRPVNGVFPDSPTSATILVGPEGGFSEAEVEEILDVGGAGVSLGNVNYRAETASIVLATLWLNAVAPDRDRDPGSDRTANPNRSP